MYRRIFTTYLINSSRFSALPKLPECRTSGICQLSTLSGNDEWKNSSPAPKASEIKVANVDVGKAVASLGDKFNDSFDLLEDAKSSLGTVYFSSDMTDAEQSIEETLSDFQRLSEQIDGEQRAPLGHTFEQKMEELKVQLHLLKESAKTLKMHKY